MDHKKRRRSVVIAALVLCLAAVTGLGTLAWLTAQDNLTNEFTVGNFGSPDKEPDTDKGEGEDEDEDESNNPNENNHYLFETAWNESDEHKLMNGVSFAKNPNVGISEGSDDAYVFIYIKNNTVDSDALTKYSTTEKTLTYEGSAPFFTLEHQWSAVVDGGVKQVTESTSTEGIDEDALVDGLFVYSKGAENGVPVILKSATGEDPDTGDRYTGELFTDVTLPQDVDMRVFKSAPDNNIEVYAFIYGANGELGADSNDDGSANAAVKAAMKWAKDLGWTAKTSPVEP